MYKHDGLLFEPRSFWDVKRIEIPPGVNFPVFIGFENPQAFYNGERYPIEINEIAVAPINYVVEYTPSSFPPSTLLGALVHSKLHITVVGRQYYSRSAVPLSLFSSKRCAPQTMRNTPFSATSSNLSGLTGSVFKAFERPFVLPEFGAVEFHLSSIQGVQSSITPPDSGIRATVAWYEAGGLLEGSVRFKSYGLVLDQTIGSPNPFGAPIGTLTPSDSAQAQPAFFPPQHLYSSKEFKSQSPTRQGAQRFEGIALHLDQRAYDAGLLSTLGNVPLTSVALRMGCRIRTTDGGTKADWWRPGAPIGLVFTTITPALVYRMPKPITLSPGDAIQLHLEVINASEFAPFTFQVGVALNGYAAIEG